MKINIVTNTFGNYHRQDIAKESWRYLESKYPELIEVHDLQFKHNVNAGDSYTKRVLTRHSGNILRDSTKKLPLVSEILKESLSLSSKEDYIIFLNSDVILMPNLIEYILNKKPNAMSSSRMDIADVESFQSILNKNVTPIRYECYGSDVFVFSRNWLLTRFQSYFSRDYFFGSWRWDNVWTAWIKLLEPNQPLGVYTPPYAFHIHHGLDSVMKETVEKTYNQKLLDTTPQDKLAFNIYSNYLENYMLKRPDAPRFFQLAPDELEKELAYFNAFKL